jgi:septum formation protein
MSEAASLWRRGGEKILASKSATRLAMLSAAALPVAAVAAEIDERAVEAAFLGDGGALAALAGKLADEKALAVSRLHPEALVIAADQTLTLKAELFHKAATRLDASAKLRRLAGRRHRLTSAVAVAVGGRVLWQFADHAELMMRTLDDAVIERYLDVAGDAALQSVGAYQIEGVGVHLFSRVVGAQATILGLPLLPLVAWLREQEMIGP